jgi:hypothetical protein
LNWKGGAICISGWVALLIYMAKLGSESCARILSPYYPILFALILLLPGMGCLVRRRWWRAGAMVAALSAFPLVVLSPARPLWPAITLCRRGVEALPNNQIIRRCLDVYSNYRNRADALAPLRQYVPSEAKAVGFIGADDSEVALWRPFGQRRVVEMVPSNVALFQENGWLTVATEEGIQSRFHQPVDDWLKSTGGVLVDKVPVLQKLVQGPVDWLVIRFEKKAGESY